jgi:hypothetical protein
MRRIVVVAAIAGLLSIASGVHAQTVSVTFSTSTNVACTVGFAQNCPSGNCTCQVYIGSATGGSVGKGSATLSITLDNGFEVPSSPTGGVCVPIYGDLSMNGTKDVEDDNLIGTFCDQAKQNLPQPIMGGYGISTSNTGKTGNNGTYTGNYTHLKGVIRITLRPLEE